MMPHIDKTLAMALMPERISPTVNQNDVSRLFKEIAYEGKNCRIGKSYPAIVKKYSHTLTETQSMIWAAENETERLINELIKAPLIIGLPDLEGGIKWYPNEPVGNSAINAQSTAKFMQMLPESALSNFLPPNENDITHKDVYGQEENYLSSHN